MWNSIKERIFPFLIALSALSVSASAAFYSVTGLSMLFAGASLAVIIMAASLEIAKLVIASLLYQYRKTLPKLLKIYLTIAAAVLILITSAGIYGYLSAAYQKTADQTSIVDSKITSLESKKKLFEETRDNILKEKQSIANLQGTLSQASTTQYTDKNGNLVVRSNNAAVRNIESASKSNEKLSAKIDVVNDSIFSLESRILEIKTTSTAESELGPLKYLSQLTGVSMDRIINWYILVIIFVFDPLAIALVIAANFAFAQLTKRKETPIEEKVEDMRKVVDAYDDLKGEINEWEEASLQDLQDWYEEEENIPEPNEVLKQAAEKYKEQVGVPIMVDPKTGKFFYEEPDPEPTNLDLDNDGVVEEEEIKEVFDKADTDGDGIINEEEIQQANLDPEVAKKLNELNESISKVKSINEKQKYDFNWNELDSVQQEIDKIKKLSFELGSLNNKKKDDNTITYF
jgi:hypothetical protein